jgi:hypothetical protein
MVTALVLLFTWCASWCVARLFHAAFEAAPRRARGKAQLLQ